VTHVHGLFAYGRLTSHVPFRLEEALANALRAVISPAIDQKEPETLDARAKFYALHKRESDEFGREFVKQYDEDLNATLIFVSATPSYLLSTIQLCQGWFIFCCSDRFHRCRTTQPGT
jgi:hypothetical protein